MKLTRYLVSLVLLAAVPATASAQGVAGLNWNSCSGPIDRTITADANNSLYASVMFHSAGHKAYQVFVGFSSVAGIRDAWRFDAPGCQGSSFLTIDHLAPAAVVKACPSFQGALQSLQIKDYSYDVVTGKTRGVLANSYPAGIAGSLPGQRYFLARFLFDHTFSVAGPTTPGVDCGGLDVTVCAHFLSAAWLSLDGVETEWAKNPEFVTANDRSAGAGCFPTPAENTTWGAIKAQYKR